MGITQIMILKVLTSLKMAKSDCDKKATRDVEDPWMIKHSENITTCNNIGIKAFLAMPVY